ncbi:MAG: hypothetical protein ABGW87_03305 [Sphingomonadaceae bacterium]
MANLHSLDELAAYLETSGIECSVAGEFVEMPCNEAQLTATLHLTGGWLVFKAYLGEWQFKEAAFCTILRLQDRLIGLRFSVVDRELWALQDFPLEVLGDGLHVFIKQAKWVLGIMLPALKLHLVSEQPMSEDDIDAMFDGLEAKKLN